MPEYTYGEEQYKGIGGKPKPLIKGPDGQYYRSTGSEIEQSAQQSWEERMANRAKTLGASEKLVRETGMAGQRHEDELRRQAGMQLASAYGSGAIPMGGGRVAASRQVAGDVAAQMSAARQGYTEKALEAQLAHGQLQEEMGRLGEERGLKARDYQGQIAKVVDKYQGAFTSGAGGAASEIRGWAAAESDPIIRDWLLRAADQVQKSGQSGFSEFFTGTDYKAPAFGAAPPTPI
jgi:hypothetical protein